MQHGTPSQSRHRSEPRWAWRVPMIHVHRIAGPHPAIEEELLGAALLAAVARQLLERLAAASRPTDRQPETDRRGRLVNADVAQTDQATDGRHTTHAVGDLAGIAETLMSLQRREWQRWRRAGPAGPSQWATRWRAG